jgi:hypothetical protein
MGTSNYGLTLHRWSINNNYYIEPSISPEEFSIKTIATPYTLTDVTAAESLTF